MAEPLAPALPSELPVVPLRGTVVLPLSVSPLGVSRPTSIEAVNRALAGDRMVLTLLQTNDTDEPGADDLHKVGTVCVIRQMAKAASGMRVLVEGIARARAEFLQVERGVMQALLKPLKEPGDRTVAVDARVRHLQELVDRALSLATGLSPEIKALVTSMDDPLRIAYLLASLLDMKPEDKQKLLEENDLEVKLDAVAMALSREIEVLELKGRIESRAEQEMTDAQRQYVLRQQLKAIQSELGEGDSETQAIRTRIAEAKLPERVEAAVMREVDRLERMTPASPEYQMLRTYIDWVLDIPWDKPTEDRLDPVEARRVLDEDHYDLDKVKERIVEYLAVQKLRQRTQEASQDGSGDGSGTGRDCCADERPHPLFRRSSGSRQDLARPVDRAGDEPQVREDLTRRRTRRGRDSRTSPDLHRVDARTPRSGPEDCRLVEPRVDARRDRQDLGRHPGRSCSRSPRSARPGAEPRLPRSLPGDPDRPLACALHRHRQPARHDPSGAAGSHGDDCAQRLHGGRKGPNRPEVPRAAPARGARAGPGQIEITDGALRAVIREYTREAGVRTLERQIGAIARKVAARVAADPAHTARVDAEHVPDYLGPPKVRGETQFRTSRPGVATGLAWTETGGDVLYIEAALLPGGSGQVILTGQLGSVMQESARAALSHIRQNARDLGISPEFLSKQDIHIHVPAGAIPKDGPSAGVTMATAVVSAARGVPVRSDVAMTGEITLSGLVLPVGGIREKTLAARRLGIRTIILPAMNEIDLSELPEDARKDMTFHPVETLDEALAVALPVATPHV